MPRLEKAPPANATLSRRGVLTTGAALALAGCGASEPLTASRTPRLDMGRLNDQTARLAEEIRPAVLGMGLMNLESGEHFSFGGDQRFPLAGAFALPLAAAVLAETEAGRLSLDEQLVLDEQQLSPPPSAIAQAWPDRRDYTAAELLRAATSGDSTAADVLMKRVGGPGAVTAWLDGKRVRGVRVDRYARQVLVERHGLPSFRPEWRTEGVFAQAIAMQPQEARLAAMRRYMTDPRDTATPQGMLEFLSLLAAGQLIPRPAARNLFRTISRERGRARIVSAARSDLGLTPAMADVGVFALPERRAYALAIFVAGSDLDGPGRARLLGELTQLARSSLG